MRINKLFLIGVSILVAFTVSCQPPVDGPDIEPTASPTNSPPTQTATSTPTTIPIATASPIAVSCSVAELVDAITVANTTPSTIGVINLDPNCVYILDTVWHSGDGDSGLPAISSYIIIHGNGATLHTLRVTNAQYLRALNITTGGSLSIDNVIFTRGPLLPGYPTGSHYGGAIVNNGTLVVSNVTFLGNRAGKGGAIGNWGTLIVENSIFTDNSSTLGGAIHTDGSAQIINTEFITNSVSGRGGAIALTGGSLSISGSLFDHNQAFPFLGVSGGAAIFNDQSSLIIENSIFADNSAAERGGAIRSQGNTTIRDSEFIRNIAPSGGALTHGTGTMEIINSKFTDNLALVYGGAINIEPFGIATIDSSLFTGNTAASGGGINAVGNTDVTLLNTTLSQNTTNSVGYGSVVTEDIMAIHYSTIANNLGNSSLGLFVKAGGNLTIGNSIVANNPGDCAIAGGFHPSNENIDSDGTCTGFTITDDPLLAPLADNGGDTMTHALLPNSPALDIATGSCLAVDQRGFARPAGLGCDLGAYEKDAQPPTPTPTPTMTSTPTATATALQITNTPTSTVVPTSTSTPTEDSLGPMILPVEAPSRCRTGPHVYYETIQYLQVGELLTALGKAGEVNWLVVASSNSKTGICCVTGSALGLPIAPYYLPVNPEGTGDCIPVDLDTVPLDPSGQPVNHYDALPICPAPPLPTPTPRPTATEEPGDGGHEEGCMWAINQDSQHTCEVPCPSGGHSQGACTP